jgi:hypothetical protein
MPAMKRPTCHTSIRINADDRKALARLCKLTGITNNSQAIRLAVREAVKAREGK